MVYRENTCFIWTNVLTGLPGVILELVATKWRTIYTATKITNEEIKVVEPKEGKAVTSKQFGDIKKKLSQNSIYRTTTTYPRIDTRMPGRQISY